jgi:nucleoside-diphosphate-sugar epimerase
MSSVLVTGATGFAGSHLTRRLLSERFKVNILARPDSNYSVLELLGARVIHGDITDMESVEKAVSGVDTVYHIAALFRKAKFPDSAYWATNYDGTMNVMRACQKAGVKRIVHCSTVGVLGNIDNPPADETTPYNPGDIYQETKCAAERDVLQLYETEGLPVTVVRPAGIYGPGDTRWLKLFRSIARGKFAMIGSGKTLIHLVYISDLIDIFRLAADSPDAPGRVYIGAGERYISLNEFAETIADTEGVALSRMHIPVGPVHFLSGVCEDLCRAVGMEPPIYRRRVHFFMKDRAFSISKAKTELGYDPKVDVEEGVQRTVAWYLEEGLI